MQPPFFDRLEKSRTVLLVGAGGGYDIFCGLPILHWLKNRGKTVHLANLSFTDLGRCTGERPVESLLRVDRNSGGPASYFPELHLVAFLDEHFPESSIYAIQNGGPAAVREAYHWMVSECKPDTILLVDGGTDSLMRGDEDGLGTPEEDSCSLWAASQMQVSEKLLVCLGFGIDHFHGVCHAHFLENVAALIRSDSFLGSFSLQRAMAEYRFFRDACQYVFRMMPQRTSIVNGSIISAVEGEFGDIHSTHRTRGSELFINPLMAIYWTFELDQVAKNNLYLPFIQASRSREELSLLIERFQASLPLSRPARPIPH